MRFLGGLGEGLGVSGKVCDVLGKFWEALDKPLGRFWGRLGNFVSKFWEVLKEVLEEVWVFLQKVLGGLGRPGKGLGRF